MTRKFRPGNPQDRESLRRNLEHAADEARTQVNALGIAVAGGCGVFEGFIKARGEIDFEFDSRHLISKGIAAALAHGIDKIPIGGAMLVPVGKSIVTSMKSTFKAQATGAILGSSPSDVKVRMRALANGLKTAGVGISLRLVTSQPGSTRNASTQSTLASYLHVSNRLQKKLRKSDPYDNTIRYSTDERFMAATFWDATTGETTARLEKYYGIPCGTMRMDIVRRLIYQPFIDKVAEYYGEQTSSTQTKSIVRRLLPTVSDLPRTTEFRDAGINWFLNHAYPQK